MRIGLFLFEICLGRSLGKFPVRGLDKNVLQMTLLSKSMKNIPPCMFPLTELLQFKETSRGVSCVFLPLVMNPFGHLKSHCGQQAWKDEKEPIFN